MRDESAPPVTKNGKPVADPALRDTENVPLTEDIDEYMAREGPAIRAGCLGRLHQDEDLGMRFRSLAISPTSTLPPRPLEEIDAEIKQLEAEILELLGEVVT